jgi:Cu/Ag efflux protein CusF
MNARTPLCLIAVGVLATSLMSPAARAADPHSAHHTPTSSPAAATEMTDAEVRKVDRETGRVTLKHAEIKSLDMPPMTMVFHVRDKALLEPLQVGTRVRFATVHEGGKFVITALQVMP